MLCCLSNFVLTDFDRCEKGIPVEGLPCVRIDEIDTIEVIAIHTALRSLGSTVL